MTKVSIVGAGISGGSIARLLSKYENLEIHLIEKEPDVGWGATKANTGMIHAGHEEDPEKHPLRAKLCVRGNRLWHQWSEELDIPIKWSGELMIATEEEDYKLLKKYMEMGKKNGVPGLKIVDKEELRTLEPNVTSEAVNALWAPTTGLTEPWEAIIGLVENAVENGVKMHLDSEVRNIKIKEGEIQGLETTGGFIESDVVINAAGLYADEISKMAGVKDFTIHPRKGEYYLFDEDAVPKVTRILHPPPTPKTKGVVVNRTVEGNLMLGPTAEDLPVDAKEDRSTSEDGLNFVWNWSKRLVEELPSRNKIVKTFSGLRPEPPDGKYQIESYVDPWGFVNVAGIRSPGLASAPAIAHYVKDEIIEKNLGIELSEKENWKPYRNGIKRFSDLSLEKKREAIKNNSKYGKIVCTCKEVTEAEVLDAINRMRQIGVKEITFDGVKFRTLAMFGFCQGSFCRLKLAKILSRELGVPIWRVTTKGEESEYGIGDVKVLRIEEIRRG